MIERVRGLPAGNWLATCDNCERELPLKDCGDFRAAVASIRSAGWRVCKHGDAWEHTCPACEAGDTEPEPAAPEETEEPPAEGHTAGTSRPPLPTNGRALVICTFLRRAETPIMSEALDGLSGDELRNLQDLVAEHLRHRGY